MKPEKKKLAIALICISGGCAVAYGMASNNNIVFLAGLILVIVGYLFIRRRLKQSSENIP